MVLRMLILLCFLVFPFNLFSNAYIIPIKGTIDLGLSSFVKRAIEEAKQSNASAIILDIDTHGGRLDAVDQISSYISGAKPIPVIAFVRGKAWSAGALISLSCQKIYMAKGSSIGSAEPRRVSLFGSPEIDEKSISAVRAKFRSTAEENGHSPVLAEKMVDKDILLKMIEYEGITSAVKEEEYNIKKERVGEGKIRTVPAPVGFGRGKLLNLSAGEAKTLKLAYNVVDTVDDVIRGEGFSEYEVIKKTMNWAEAMVRFFTDPMVSSLLLTLGFLGLLSELRMPGWGISGTIGVIFLILFFWGHYLVGLANWIEIILFTVGVGLLILEIFITPGFGIAGISGIILIVTSLFLAMVKHPFKPEQFEITQAFYVITYALVGSILVWILTMRFLPRTHFWKRLILVTEQKKELGYTSEANRLKKYVGRTGIADTYLRPSGRIRIENELIDAETQGEFIENGNPVIVVKIEGSRVIVKEV